MVFVLKVESEKAMAEHVVFVCVSAVASHVQRFETNKGVGQLANNAEFENKPDAESR
jgi:hypothetical protein